MLDIYTARWRPTICNAFNPEQARARALYLYKRISAGRNSRRWQLNIIAIREKKKQEKLLKMSLSAKIKKLWLHCRSKKKCHGCGSSRPRIDIKKKELQDNNNERVIVSLCHDCLE